LRKIKAEW